MRPRETFESWMENVDRAVAAKTGLRVHDLPDCSFRNWYDDGVRAKSAASRAIRAARDEVWWTDPGHRQRT